MVKTCVFVSFFSTLALFHFCCTRRHLKILSYTKWADLFKCHPDKTLVLSSSLRLWLSPAVSLPKVPLRENSATQQVGIEFKQTQRHKSRIFKLCPYSFQTLWSATLVQRTSGPAPSVTTVFPKKTEFLSYHEPLGICLMAASLLGKQNHGGPGCLQCLPVRRAHYAEVVCVLCNREWQLQF